MMPSGLRIACGVLVAVGCFTDPLLADDKPKPQYEHGDIRVPAARGDELKRKQVSVERALNYLDQGTMAWNRHRGCVTCHTNGTYMMTRPALTPHLGEPAEEVRAFFVDQLEEKASTEREKLLAGVGPAQVIYIAAGLAEWDAHVNKELSTETKDALTLMFDLQLESGTWGAEDCWPPYESSSYHLATVAAMAVATAPTMLDNTNDEKQRAVVARLKHYLRTQRPPHDYGRVLLLWAATRMSDLLDEEQKQNLVDLIWQHQREDGGWSIRTFAKPEGWGRGNRAEKLRSELDFGNPPSDGHQTGLSILVLREAGVDANDPRIQRGVQWLLTNQRESGRWWTRSLNTDRYHFITYSGTAFPLLALSLCDSLPEQPTPSSIER